MHCERLFYIYENFSQSKILEVYYVIPVSQNLKTFPASIYLSRVYLCGEYAWNIWNTHENQCVKCRCSGFFIFNFREVFRTQLNIYDGALLQK